MMARLKLIYVSGQRIKRRLLVCFLAFSFMVASVLLSQPASASCTTLSGCTNGSTVASKAATTTVNVAITTFKVLVYEYITMVKDALTRLANQDSNNLDKTSKNAAAMIDTINATSAALALSAARWDAAQQMLISRTACRSVSNATRINSMSYGVQRQLVYDTSSRKMVDYASNAPGGPTERGSIQAAQGTFLDIMNGFCDSAVMKPPAGVNCTLVNDSQGNPMSFRYTQPYQALFGVPNGIIPADPTNPEHRAARLMARMAIEPVPTDPIRGPVLTREEGRGSFIRRQSDIASMNLAQGAMDHLVDDRVADGTGISLEYNRQRAWADASGIARDAIDSVGQPVSANMDQLATMIGDVNRLYLQIYTNLERIAAIKAAHLARLQADGNGGRSLSVGSISVNN